MGGSGNGWDLVLKFGVTHVAFWGSDGAVMDQGQRWSASRIYVAVHSIVASVGLTTHVPGPNEQRQENMKLKSWACPELVYH